MHSKILDRAFLIRYRILLIVFIQLVMVSVSYTAAFFIRFEFVIPAKYLLLLYSTLPILAVSRMIAYFIYRLHLGSWRFVSLQDLIATIQAVVLGSVIFVVLMVFTYGLEDFPRSVFLLEMIMNVMLLGGSRFMIRYYHEINERGRAKIQKYVIIAGAGKAGVLLLNEIRNNPELGIHVVGFVDDNPYRKGIYIQSVEVLGNTNEIPKLVKQHGIDEVIIAIPSAKYKNVSRIMDIVHKAKVKATVLPGMGKMIRENSFNGYLKEVSYDELLGRKIIKFCRETDYRLMEREIKNKAVLVTGAGGSIGSELCRQMAQFGSSNIIMYDRYENSLYDLELELRKEFPDQLLTPVIGDILDINKVGKIIKTRDVKLIYHAAAYKHVPIMEREPEEAVRNNVFGTMNVAKLAVEHKIEKFVLISTDKAVNPANIMGTTKRIGEMIIQGLNGYGTKLIAVRFGNVIGSNGSVIPLFKKQIAEGGPITLTHPDITRYFMSIPEAVQLVMTAGAMGKGAEIFLLDMGEPIKIADIARELIRLSGLDPEEDIDIACTGLRPGEKLHEELYWQGEGIVPTDNKKITMLKPNGTDYQELFKKIKILEEHTNEQNIGGIIRMLKEIVPESIIKSQDKQILIDKS